MGSSCVLVDVGGGETMPGMGSSGKDKRGSNTHCASMMTKKPANTCIHAIVPSV